MKKIQAKYSENSIIYWPSYAAGRIGIIYLGVVGIPFIATLIWTLLDNPSNEARLETQMALPLVVIALCTVFSLIYRKMHTKIIVSSTGIEYFKNDNVAEKKIKWEDVSAIYFKQELWYGRKTCRIFLKNSGSLTFGKNNKCDFVLPVYSVDEQKLLQLIPDYLWKNHPCDNWGT